MEQTEVLNNFKGDPELWAIGSIEVGESEWKSEIPTFQRLAAFNLQENPGDFSIVQVHSDFHKGLDLVVISVIKTKQKESLDFNTTNGLITILGDERAKFSEITRKLS
jgi:hypothetical protein